ncbi:hypothetical protein PR048_017360 [Dryococelus australis]|uniref:Uncharacterized protein n=1 Tax=Dryococelus australis TaxID=614101 RepID=A0ABQ9H9A6_9NEOP|nr:hypothetical protein PR048_017360 [Dryococelus australis]
MELYKARKEALMNHIESFQQIEWHHSRGRNCERIYQSNDLNVRKMWSIVCEANYSSDLQVKYEYYLKIFDTEFNIRFSTTLVNTCSTVSSLKHMTAHAKIKKREKDELQQQLTYHELRDGVFYKCLQEDKDDELTLIYHCQKT